MRHLSLAVMLLACCAALPAGADDVEGRVVGPDGKPVAGAKVYATSYVREAPPEGESWKSEVRTALTDAAGRFRIEDVYCPPDRRMNHFALVQAAGFALGGTAFMLPAKEPLPIRLAPAAPWRAVVVDTAGRPVPNCPVRLDRLTLNFSGMPYPSGWVGLQATGKDGQPLYPSVHLAKTLYPLVTKRTNARGEVLFASAPRDGELALSVTPEDYAHQSWHSIRTGDRQPHRLVVRRAGTLAGRVVVGSPGEPRASILLSAYTESDGARPGEARTDDQGRYAFGNLLPGEYLIRARIPADLDLTAAPLVVLVSPGHASQAPDLKLVPGGVVTGRVTDSETGQPLAGARVHAVIRQCGFAATTDAEGRYHLRLPPWRGHVEYSGGVGGYQSDTPGSRVRVRVEEEKSVTADLKLVKGALPGTWRTEATQVTLRPGTYPMTWVDDPESREHRYFFGGSDLAGWSTARPASIKREPPLPKGAARRYSQVALGEPEKRFPVILEESVKGKGVDVLYADTDGDGDLAEETRLSRYVRSELSSGRYQEVAFPSVTFACPTGEKTRPVTVHFEGYQVGGRPAVELSRWLAGYWEGEIETDKGKLGVLMSDPRGAGGTTDRDAGFILDLAGGENQRQGRAQLVCGKLYRFLPSPVGDQLTIEEYDGPTGSVKLVGRDGRGGQAVVESSAVTGSAGGFQLGNGDAIPLPPGIYTLSYARLACGEGGSRTTLTLKPKKPFSIEEGKTTEIPLGGPLDITLQGAYTAAPAKKGKAVPETRLVFARGSETKVKIEMADSGGASVRPDSRAQSRKAFHGALLDRKGKRVVQATIEYG